MPWTIYSHTYPPHPWPQATTNPFFISIICYFTNVVYMESCGIYPKISAFLLSLLLLFRTISLRLIQVLALTPFYCSVGFNRMGLTVCLATHPLKDIWLVSRVRLLWIKLWSFMHKFLYDTSMASSATHFLTCSHPCAVLSPCIWASPVNHINQ